MEDDISNVVFVSDEHTGQVVYFASEKAPERSVYMVRNPYGQDVEAEMAELEVPNFPMLLMEPLLAVPEESRVGFIARLERSAADRYGQSPHWK